MLRKDQVMKKKTKLFTGRRQREKKFVEKCAECDLLNWAFTESRKSNHELKLKSCVISLRLRDQLFIIQY